MFSRHSATSLKGPGGILLFLALAFFMPTGISAQGWIEPLRPRPGVWVERVESKIRVEIQGNVATVVVDEWFRAHGQGLGEADFLYPLPSGAAFTGFSLYQGEQELRGEVMDAERAVRSIRRSCEGAGIRPSWSWPATGFSGRGSFPWLPEKPEGSR